MRKYLDNWESAITTASIGAGDLSFDVATPPDALTAGDYYIATLTDSFTAPTKVEIIKITGVSGSTLTVERAQDGTTALTWDNTEFIHIAPTASGFETLDGPEVVRYSETEYTASSGAFDRANGGIQFYTLTASESLTFTMNDGEDMELHLFGTSTYTASWPAGTKFDGGSPPDLSTATEAVLEVFKRGVDLYVANVGDYS